MPTLTVENYLKTILALEPDDAPRDRPVGTGKIARALGVAPATVTGMVKSLEAAGLVTYRPYAGVHLTARGRDVALRVLRRHRLVELFLVETLGMDWGEVHVEAEALEHAISDRVLERLDEFLGRPSFDPHGDPIPLASGEVPDSSGVPLAEKSAGDRVVVSRLLDQTPGFLEMAERERLRPGAEIAVVATDESADVITVESGERRLALSTAVASKIAVEEIDENGGRRGRRGGSETGARSE